MSKEERMLDKNLSRSEKINKYNTHSEELLKKFKDNPTIENEEALEEALEEEFIKEYDEFMENKFYSK